MSFQSSPDTKTETVPAPDTARDDIANKPLVFAASALPDSRLDEASWPATHVPQNRRLIAAIRERKG